MLAGRFVLSIGLMLIACGLSYSTYALVDQLLPILDVPQSQVLVPGQVLSWVLICSTLASVVALILSILLIRTYSGLKKRLAKRSYELEHLTRLLKKSERHLQAVLDGTYDGIISIDQQGRIENFNAGASAMFGYDRNEVLGKNIDIIIPDDEKYQHREVIKGAGLEGKKVIRRARQLYGQHKKGGLIPVEVTLNKIMSDDQVKYVGVIRDVSDLTLERNNLVTALAEAESANEAKNRLLSSASHELRTPLNAILGFSEILITDSESINTKQRAEHLQDIHRSAELLLLLVNDVLDFAKLDSGLVSLDLKPVRFSTLLQECLRMTQVEIDKKQIHCSVECEESGLVLADYLRLQQVLLNLLSNACKYNIDGGSIRVVAKSREPGRYCIDVIDSGIGIVADKLPDLFQPFSRLHDLRLPIEGSGIGLSLCKNLIESMGGTIEYHPNPIGGSVFTVCMPLAKKEQLECYQDQTILPVPVARSRCRILYVEDNVVNIRLMKAMLSRLDIDMDSVTSGEAALDYLQAQQPDIILMDINLPGLSGRETAERIRSNHMLDKVPMIAVSASILDSLGPSDELFFDCIGKPFRAERIRSVIEQASQKLPC